MATERTYTINIRSEIMKVPRYKRAKKAVTAVREFTQKHMKSEDVKIGHFLNKKLWENGIKNVPTSVKVVATKNDSGTVHVELVGMPKEYTQILKKQKVKAEKAKIETKKETKTDAKVEQAKEATQPEVKEADVTPKAPVKKAKKKAAKKKAASTPIDKQ